MQHSAIFIITLFPQGSWPSTPPKAVGAALTRVTATEAKKDTAMVKNWILCVCCFFGLVESIWYERLAGVDVDGVDVDGVVLEWEGKKDLLQHLDVETLLKDIGPPISRLEYQSSLGKFRIMEKG